MANIVDIVSRSGCTNFRAVYADGTEVRIIGGPDACKGITLENFATSFVEGVHPEYGKYLYRKSTITGSLLNGTLRL